MSDSEFKVVWCELQERIALGYFNLQWRVGLFSHPKPIVRVRHLAVLVLGFIWLRLPNCWIFDIFFPVDRLFFCVFFFFSQLFSVPKRPPCHVRWRCSKGIHPPLLSRGCRWRQAAWAKRRCRDPPLVYPQLLIRDSSSSAPASSITGMAIHSFHSAIPLLVSLTCASPWIFWAVAWVHYTEYLGGTKNVNPSELFEHCLYFQRGCLDSTRDHRLAWSWAHLVCKGYVAPHATLS